VSVDGVSYTGSAGTIITGADGTFASDVRKSELAGEDLDSNGQKGEVLEAHVVATGTGVFVADAFETPTVQGSVGQASRPGCKPTDCDCLDLGDLEVEFEEPRLCELTVQSLFSGSNVVGGDGPLALGDAVAGATVRASLAGGVQIPQAAVTAACDGADCGPGLVPESGITTFAVPVIGDEPQVQLDASWSVTASGKLHYYSGSLVVPGCARDETAAADFGPLNLDHAEVTGLGDFITSLGDAVKTPIGGTNPNAAQDASKPFGAGGCGCHVAGGARSNSSSALLSLGLLLGALFSRRRRAT
jgi:MYXO-CTERM domain-containing protein